MRRLTYILILVLLISGVFLTAYSPDDISTVFTVVMEIVMVIGIVFGILPVLQYAAAFQNGSDNIDRILESQAVSVWSGVSQTEEFILLTTEAKFYRQNHMTGPGAPELEAALGDEFIVDYVRVYDIVE